MPSGITLAAGVLVGSPIALDAKYGPYDTAALALADLTSGLRYQGLTVGIKSGSSIVEYWFKDGVGDANFVEKVSAAADWNTLLNKPSTFAPSAHTHDDRYYTETETDTLLSGKANSSHTHSASDISDSTTAGRALLTAATVQAQRTALEIFVSAANLTAIQALTGNFQRVYIAQDTQKIYAWSGTGSVYTEISPHIKSDWSANSGDAQILNKPRSPYQLIAACSDETSLLTTGTKLVFRVFEMMFINTFRASVTQAPSGSSLVVQLRTPTNDVLGTVTIAAGTSASSTNLGTTLVEYMSDAFDFDSSLEFNIHVHQIGSTSAGRGLKIYLEGTRVL
jgi:hypothetical protein